jgi:hypothetical protein
VLAGAAIVVLLVEACALVVVLLFSTSSEPLFGASLTALVVFGLPAVVGLGRTERGITWPEFLGLGVVAAVQALFLVWLTAAVVRQFIGIEHGLDGARLAWKLGEATLPFLVLTAIAQTVSLRTDARWFRAAGAAAGLAVLFAAGGAGAATVAHATRADCAPLAPADGDFAHGGPLLRERIARALVHCRRLEGMRRPAVARLLGSVDTAYALTDSDYGFLDRRVETLVLEYGADGRVSSARIDVSIENFD